MIPALGETASLTRTVTESDIQQFADLVGDHNPVHVDDTFAKKHDLGVGLPMACGEYRLSQQCLERDSRVLELSI